MAGVPAWKGSLISREMLDRTLTQIQAETGVAPREILSDGRSRRIAHARQYAMWKLRQITNGDHPRYALPEIGYVFKRDHTTVIHGLRRYEERLAAERAGEGA